LRDGAADPWRPGAKPGAGIADDASSGATTLAPRKFSEHVMSRSEHPTRHAPIARWAAGARRRALTLIESLIASAILLMSVLALTSALAAGQAAAIEEQKLLLGSLAVDDLLSELWSEDYDDLLDYDGVVDSVGAMQTLDGEDYPDAFWMIGRRVEVETRDIKVESAGVIVRGRLITVTAFDADRDLVSAELFVAEPAGGG
jgi:hypothetical protein